MPAGSVGCGVDRRSARRAQSGRHESEQRNGSPPVRYAAIWSTSPGANCKPARWPGCLITMGRRARLRGSMTSESSTTSASPARSGAVLKSSERTVAVTQTALSSRDNANRTVIAEGVFGDPRNTSWQTFDTGGGGGNIESRAVGGRRRWPQPIRGSRPSPLRSPRSGDSRSAAIEETFMIAPLVIVAPNTWNGSVPTRFRLTTSRNAPRACPTPERHRPTSPRPRSRRPH
jgi:hypothetical protein